MKRIRMTTDVFIPRANIKHNSKYNYSLVNCSGNRDKVIIICPFHGQFKQIVSNHLAGQGCQACSNVERITLEKAQNIAKTYGGECLSEGKINATNHLKWKCADGHIFEKPYNEVKNHGVWCNLCSLPWKSEGICRVYFETIFDKKFPKVRPNWLINSTGHKLELDGFCEELKLAFEHHGEQHYSDLSIFSRSKLEYTQNNDLNKLKICKEMDINLIEIPQLFRYTSFEKLENIVKSLALQYGIILKDNYTYDFSHLTKSSYCLERLKLFQEIAEKNDGKCLSTEYLTARCTYKFECAIGHTWKMNSERILTGYWCPKCKSKERTLSLINNIKKEELKNLYIENKSILKLSKLLDISEQTTKKILKYHNISIHKNK